MEEKQVQLRTQFKKQFLTRKAQIDLRTMKILTNNLETIQSKIVFISIIKGWYDPMVEMTTGKPYL